jgi:predicted transcriptional regulator
LADRAVLSLNTVKRLDAVDDDPRISTVSEVKAAFLEAGGVEFLPAGGGKGEGLRLAADY